ncbi:MAG: mechanosensitive ion channel [Minwuia sp.]|nr:mechanosensitive ion channel [Minwuia sp.]
MDSEKASETVDFLVTYAAEYAIAVVGVIVILVVGFIAAGWVGRAVRSMLGRSKKTDPLITNFVAAVARYGVIAFTIIAALDQFGVETTSFVAVMGAAGLAIGLAFQGTLGNLAAGVMILAFRPFRQGHFIEGGGVSGTVDSVSLFVTEMHTADNVHIIVPNGSLWNTAIKNYSHHATRRCDFVLGIGYGSSHVEAMKALNAMAGADARVLKEPAPQIVVSNLGDSSVDITIRLWCNAGDYWGLKFDFTQAMKEKMDELGIEIPFPQRAIHMIKDAAD